MVAEALVAGTFEAVIEGSLEAVIEGTVEAVIEGALEAVVYTIADIDESILIVPEAVVAWGSVADIGAIAIAVRLYFMGSTCLAS